MEQLPAWVQYLEALGTPIIAVIVAIVAFMQWRTNHQQVILALFERRMSMIDEVKRIVGKVLTTGQIELLPYDYGYATRGANYIFPKNVTEYLHQNHHLLVEIMKYEDQIRNLRWKDAEGHEKEIHELRRQQAVIVDQLDDFGPELDRLAAPFVAMHQRHLWV